MFRDIHTSTPFYILRRILIYPRSRDSFSESFFEERSHSLTIPITSTEHPYLPPQTPYLQVPGLVEVSRPHAPASRADWSRKGESANAAVPIAFHSEWVQGLDQEQPHPDPGLSYNQRKTSRLPSNATHLDVMGQRVAVDALYKAETREGRHGILKGEGGGDSWIGQAKGARLFACLLVWGGFDGKSALYTWVIFHLPTPT